ncbi:hypothetical protein AB833_13275 [Chromatiales bacterium (ex Bugula neritina AB1)]|nr:hypothetical protein AB833_13275 [Chromatiales bacterium (ex Bugula neritina AB1)]
MQHQGINSTTMNTATAIVSALVLLAALPGLVAAEATLDKQSLRQFARQVCSTPDALEDAAITVLGEPIRSSKSEMKFRGTVVGQRITLHGSSREVIAVQLLTPPARRNQTIVTSYADEARHSRNAPLLELAFDADCQLFRAQAITYDNNNTPLYIETLGPSLEVTGDPEWLNAPIPSKDKSNHSATRVAMIDSGVNYQLPLIANALARDAQGETIGYDFWEMDNKPFDSNPARSPFFVQRHGTRSASILLREAPGIALVPYRYPRPDMSRMVELVEHAAQHRVRIIGMPLGSNTYADWAPFATVAGRHPEILFIVSAGNNGRDIDRSPVYPAAMEIENMLVVTSVDDFVYPAERTNYGRLSVDYLVPAEKVPALDFDGSEVLVSGSSYAVSRVAALAARLLKRNPGFSTEELKQAIRGYAIRANTSKYVALGYLGDPLADTINLPVTIETVAAEPVNNSARHTTPAGRRYEFPLTLVILDPRWQNPDISRAVEELNEIFSQCNITARVEKQIVPSVPAYLQDLSPGNALSLHRHLKLSGTRVFFGRDTLMQPAFDAEAFGAGNTRNRPWMTGSLWLTYGIRDVGVALAHELFHILANSGKHNQLANNLLREQTAPGNTHLTGEQCEQAQRTGIENGLLVLN